MFKASLIDAPVWLYPWEGMKFAGKFIYLLLIALVAVADIFMFLLLFTNGVTDPAPRGTAEHGWQARQVQSKLPLQQGRQDEPRVDSSAQDRDLGGRDLPGTLLTPTTERKTYAAGQTHQATGKANARSFCGEGR